MNGEVLDHRIGEQGVRDLLNRGFIDRIADVEFEALPLSHTLYAVMPEPGQSPENGLPLWIGDLRFEHDIDNHPGHVSSLTGHPDPSASDAYMNGRQPVLTCRRSACRTLAGECPNQRSCALRAELAPDGEVLVGYVGRLAAEKQVDLLAGLPTCPASNWIVGDGSRRAALMRRLPGAHLRRLLVNLSTAGSRVRDDFRSAQTLADAGHAATCQRLRTAAIAPGAVAASGDRLHCALVDRTDHRALIDDIDRRDRTDRLNWTPDSQ